MKKQTIILAFFIMVSAAFGLVLINQSNSMKAMEASLTELQSENDALKGLISENEAYKNEVAGLESDLKALNETVKEKEQEIEQYEILKEVFDIKELSDQDLMDAKDISLGTPLDIKASLSVVKYSKHYDIKPSLLLSMIELESNFEQYEVGADQDRGYLQIIPGTEKWLAEAFGSKMGLDYDPDKIFEPDYNIGLAASYIAFLRNAYGENYSRILSEYNRGPYNLAKYYNEYQTYSTSYSRIILNKESKYLVYND